MKKERAIVRGFFCLLFSLSISAVQAAYVVAPNANEVTPGSTNTFMFGTGGATVARLQWVFPATDFSSLTSGTNIVSIGFRADTIFGDLSYSQWDLQMSTAVNPNLTLDSTFDTNIGADVVTVYSGALDIVASSLTGGDFFDIDFTLPYAYSGGDLLMTLMWWGSPSNHVGIEANAVADGLGNTNFIFQGSPWTGFTQGTTDYYNYPITRFGISANPVPEPSSLALVASALGLLAMASRKLMS